MANEGCSLALSGCAFTQNACAEEGGGMRNYECSVELTGCTFTENLGAEGGGTASRYGDLAVTDCLFSGNEVTSTGGGMWAVTSSTLALVRCTFTGNVADHQGGGLLTGSGSSMTASHCFFIKNASTTGGGLYDSHSPWQLWQLAHCVFLENYASEQGGAMYQSDGGHTLVNCLFVGNTTDGQGGGISDGRSHDAPNVSVNCTFSGNWAWFGGYGGGIYALHEVVLTNCILWGNGDVGGTDESAQIHLDGGGATINHSCVQGWTGGLGGVGNIGDDPLFVQLSIPGSADDDLRLLPGSPCIDAGDNSAVPVDLANVDDDCDTAEILPVDLNGSPRFTDDPLAPDVGIGTAPIVNMGAYEGADCNGNGVLDDEDIASGYSFDVNGNGHPDECEPDLTVTVTDPPNGAIDARKPHEADGSSPYGWETVDLTFDGPIMYLTALDFETAEDGADGIPPTVTCAEYVEPQTVRLHLSEMIEVGAWTTVTHAGSGTGVTLGYLPADADGSGVANANDIVVVVDAVSASGPLYQFDTDRSGTITANDIVTLIDLLKGAEEYDAYFGAALP